MLELSTMDCPIKRLRRADNSPDDGTVPSRSNGYSCSTVKPPGKPRNFQHRVNSEESRHTCPDELVLGI
ncbi:hypothetical protein G9C98_006905 [Cotesia typhae]|uniref:Uncharacterized protein n=1 Tax=Cotesia typhae TaxID=2053667 RepID=A0A8J5R245_9HYME|nr:hypothetical protein G9C98_006905 [Cotesia typhae]